jgi:hypothetical protein
VDHSHNSISSVKHGTVRARYDESHTIPPGVSHLTHFASVRILVLMALLTKNN